MFSKEHLFSLVKYMLARFCSSVNNQTDEYFHRGAFLDSEKYLLLNFTENYDIITLNNNSRRKAMEQKKIDRISELTRISRERELTVEEQAERTELRNEYRRAFLGSLSSQLDNMSIKQPDGSIIKVKDRLSSSDRKKQD